MRNSEITNYEGTIPETKVSQDFFESQFIILRMHSRTPEQLLANLATQGNITRNNISATLFPSLARPVPDWLN